MTRRPPDGLVWIVVILLLFAALGTFVLAGSNLNSLPPASFES